MARIKQGFASNFPPSPRRAKPASRPLAKRQQKGRPPHSRLCFRRTKMASRPTHARILVTRRGTSWPPVPLRHTKMANMASHPTHASARRGHMWPRVPLTLLFSSYEKENGVPSHSR